MSRQKKKKKSKAQELIKYLIVFAVCIFAPIIPLVSGFGTVICTPENTEVRTIEIQDAWTRSADSQYDATTAFVRSTDGKLYSIEPQLMHPWYNEYFNEGTVLEVAIFYSDAPLQIPRDKETGEKTNERIVAAKCGDKMLFNLESENAIRRVNKGIALTIGFVLALPCWGLILLCVLTGILYLIQFIMRCMKSPSDQPASKKEKRKR